VSDTFDVSDIPIKTSLNMLASFTPDISDVTDSTSSNIQMLAGVSTDEQNHHASDISDTYGATPDLQFNSEQESCNIFRLGRSDIWGCENCRQKGDVHFMRELLCRGKTKYSS
jgi:hypothetical protein